MNKKRQPLQRVSKWLAQIWKQQNWITGWQCCLPLWNESKQASGTFLSWAPKLYDRQPIRDYCLFFRGKSAACIFSGKAQCYCIFNGQGQARFFEAFQASELIDGNKRISAEIFIIVRAQIRCTKFMKDVSNQLSSAIRFLLNTGLSLIQLRMKIVSLPANSSFLLIFWDGPVVILHFAIRCLGLLR